MIASFFWYWSELHLIPMIINLSQSAPWRPGYFFLGILLVLTWGAFWFTHLAWKAPQQISAINTQTQEGGLGFMDFQTPVWKSLLHPLTWVGIYLILLYTGGELTIGNWSDTLFTEGRGINPQIVGIQAGGFLAISTIGWILGVLVVSFAIAPMIAGLITIRDQRVGDPRATNTIGIQISAAILGGAILPALAGSFAESFPLEAIPNMLSISLLGMLILYLLSTRARFEKYTLFKGR